MSSSPVDKKKLKRELKARRRIGKFQTSVKQARLRKDEIQEKKAQSEFETYLSQLRMDGMGHIIDQEVLTNDNCTSAQLREEEEAKLIVLSVRNRVLKKSMDGYDRNRSHESRSARELLNSMSKGLQTKTMFENKSALYG